jgi:beta-phosphoglucomutase family hydrolase
MTSIQGVLWDLDGVITDTGELHFQTWVTSLAEMGITYTHEMFKATFGMNNAGVLTTLLGHLPEPELLTQISNRKEQLFRDAVRGRAQILPGVRDWLEHLQASGLRQAIASSAPQANIDALIDELRLRDYFGAIVSGFALPGKPDPAVFLKAAELIQVPPENCLVIEDAVPGVQAAKRAGMKCLAVMTTNPRSALSQADVIVERLDQISFTDLTGF